jgi:uncharacterized protein involved in exopolysaccharide biosynthesis
MNLFRNKTPTIAGHEQRLADLNTQLADAEFDLQRAEENATAAAIDGTGLDAAADAVVRCSAALSALRAARSTIESELADMRSREAAAAFGRRAGAAEAVAVKIADELTSLAHDVEPKLQRARELLKCSDIAAGTFASTHFVMPPLALLMTSASSLRDANFRDPDVVERVERLVREAAILQPQK